MLMERGDVWFRPEAKFPRNAQFPTNSASGAMTPLMVDARRSGCQCRWWWSGSRGGGVARAGEERWEW